MHGMCHAAKSRFQSKYEYRLGKCCAVIRFKRAGLAQSVALSSAAMIRSSDSPVSPKTVKGLHIRGEPSGNKRAVNGLVLTIDTNPEFAKVRELVCQPRVEN